jgi:YHS domain-containing protein
MSFIAVSALVFGGLVLLAGCQKEKPTAGTEATQTKAQGTTPAPVKHEAMSMPMKQEATPAPAQQATQVAEQTTCPVMGGAINKAIFVEYQGKKVYFCCQDCSAAFKADPEKYISKLPQFAK